MLPLACDQWLADNLTSITSCVAMENISLSSQDAAKQIGSNGMKITQLRPTAHAWRLDYPDVCQLIAIWLIIKGGPFLTWCSTSTLKQTCQLDYSH